MRTRTFRSQTDGLSVDRALASKEAREREVAPIVDKLSEQYPHLRIAHEALTGGQIRLSITRAAANDMERSFAHPIITILLRDRGLHAALYHLNTEVGKGREEGFFWCKAHKQAEPVDVLFQPSVKCFQQHCIEHETELQKRGRGR